jgi:hypothetical protein
MFNKKIFIEAGAFDENLFLFYEEADISNRILKTGKHLVLAKDIEVFHLKHNNTFNARLASNELDSLEYYINKYKLSPQKILKAHLLIYKIKFFVAMVLNNPSKKQLFRNWINLIKKYLVK